MVRPIAIVVDDDKDVREAISRFFSALDIECAGAEDGISALRMIMNISPMAAFVDVHLPAMDGISVLRRIREVRPYTRVVMMSAAATEMEVSDAFAYGAHRFLCKPADLYDLELVIREVLMRNLPDIRQTNRTSTYVQVYRSNTKKD